MNDVVIEGRRIGPSQVPFIIAEISGNHNQSLSRALEIVEAAGKAGAHAIKLQTYTAETMTLDINEREFVISDPASPWHGESLYQLYEHAHTPWEWHEPLFSRAKELGMIAFSSPFDRSAVDLLERLDTPCYKIASFENTDLELIRLVASTGKPIIISTGLASIQELGETVAAARSAGCKELILLKCTSAYPAPAKYSNLRTIAHMSELFNCQVGLSDHTLGIGAAIAAVACGATAIEKHLTLRRADGGVDSTFSLEPEELQRLVEESAIANAALGDVHYGPCGEEARALQFRRSLYVAQDMMAGESFSVANIRAIRPGNGLPVKFLSEALGRKAKQPIQRGTPLSWSLIA